MQNPYVIQVPREVHSGIGAIERLPQLLKQREASNIALFIDGCVFGGDLAQELYRNLQKEFTVTVVTDVPPEPEENQVREIFRSVEKIACDVIVAIGGGSVMDTAKLISVMLKNPDYREDLTRKERIADPGVPLIAVPTSAGTGAEATPNAIVLLPEKKLKVGIVHPFLLPDAVILDPRFTVTMPKSVTASTGIDAFCHCIETFISKKTNPFAELFSLKGLSLISANLRTAYNDGSNLRARESMLLAAFYGGVAITASSTVAVHALSYPLGGTYRIPHGVSNAILLAPVMRCNISAIGDKLPAIAQAMGIAADGLTPDALGGRVIQEIEALLRDVNIPQKLTGFGVTSEDLEFLTVSASEVHRLLDQNPKDMTLDDIRGIYTQLL